MRDADNQYQRELGEKFLLQYDGGRDVWSDEAQMRAFAPFALQPPDAPVSGTQVVDLGAGRGRDTLYFLERGFRVTALDLFRMPEWADIERIHAGAVEFVPQSLLDWEPAQRLGQVALVIDNGCFHHQAKSVQPAYLKKVRDMLPPEGRFAVNVFVGRGEGCAGTVELKDGRFVHVYDEPQIRSELLAAGFCVSHTGLALRPNSSFAYDYLYVNAFKIEQ